MAFEKRRRHTPIAGIPASEQDIDEDDPLYFLAKKAWDVEKVREQMYKPILDAETVWKYYPDSHLDQKLLRWTCPNCGQQFTRKTREATLKCPKCYRTLQAKDYDVDPSHPDPENPDWWLKKVAKRKGLPEDEFIEDDEQKEITSPLQW